MRTIAGALQTALNGEVIHLAMCVVMTLRNGDILRFTDHDRNITRLGFKYEAAIGFNPFAAKSTSNAEVDNIQVDGIIDSASITESDLLAGKYDFAQVECFVVDYTQPDAGKITTVTGHLGEVSTDGAEFRAQLRGLAQRLEQQILRLYSPTCDAVFGDARCGVEISHVVGTVSEILEDKIRFKITHSGVLPTVTQSITIPYNDNSGTAGSTAKGWIKGSGTFRYQVTPYSGITGADGTMLELLNSADPQTITVVQDLDLIEGASTPSYLDTGTVPFTFEVYQANQSGDTGGFAIDFLDEQKALVSGGAFSSTDIDAGTTLTQRQLTGTIPTGARVARIKLRVSGASVPDSAYFDRLSLTVGVEIANYTAVGGHVEFQPGSLNDGLIMDIRALIEESGTVMEIELYEPMGYTISVGDQMHVKAGCDKTLNTCKTVYFNVPNFRGFPHLPGISTLVNNRG